MLDENNQKNLENNVNKKTSKIKSILTPLSAGIIGSVLTFTLTTQLNLIQDNSTKTEIQNLTTNELLESVNETQSSFSIEQVSSQSIADVIEDVSQAIVGITNIQTSFPSSFHNWQNYHQGNGTNTEVESGTGSGVIYEKTDDALYIVTNHHVIEDATRIEVTLSNQEVVQAELIGTDSLTDIAVLKIEGSYDITPITFGDSDTVRVGEEVLAIGNPLGLDLYGTVTRGIISAVNRSIDVEMDGGTWEMNVIQTDAAINPGNSGGALINTTGQLIGINSMKISADEVEGLGFAIPSNEVKTIIEQLSQYGQVSRPYLGISMADVTNIPPIYLEKIANNVTEGVLIVEIDQNGSAAQAGLQIEDIIVSINGENIANSQELRKYLYTELSINETVTVEFYRDGQLKQTEVTLKSNQ